MTRTIVDYVRFSALGALLAAGLLSLASCSLLSAGRQSKPANSLVLAQQREPTSLNPALENGVSSTEWGELFFQYLVKYDERGRLVGDAAVEAPTLENGGISRDGLTIVYRLRKGLRFSDGAPLTVEDCIWSVGAINNPSNNVQSRFGYDIIAKAEARDARTLVLHLKHRFAPIVTAVLGPQGFPILPKHLLAQHRDFNRLPFSSQPVGSGPFVVVRWSRGDALEMRANPYYFAGRPKLARLVIRFVPDPQAALNLLRRGDIAGIFNVPDYSEYSILKTLPGYRLVSFPTGAVGSLIFNTQDPMTRDVRVRRALALAIDVPSLVAKSFQGAVSSRAAGRGLFGWAHDARAFPDLRYDPATARRLLEAAGWQLGSDGLRHKDGRALSLLLVLQAATPSQAIVAGTIAQYERAVGADVILKQYNATQFSAPVNQGGPVYGGKFQMALYGFVNGDDPDTTDQFSCSNVPPHGYNKSRICDPGIDEFLRAGNATYDAAERKAIYAKLERLLYAEMPLALLYQRRELDVFTSGLRGPTGSLDSVFWNVATWSLGAGAAASGGAVSARAEPSAPPWTESERAELQRQMAAIFRPGIFARSGGLAILAADGTPLFLRRAQEQLTPASTLKLVVAATALDVFGPQYRFETSFVALDQPDADGVVHGPLWLVGGGDPLLTSNDLRGGIGALRQLGIRRIEGPVVVDDGAFAGPEQNPHWDPGDLEEGYAAATSALSLDQGTVEFHVTPTVAGQPALVTIDPPNDNISIVGTVRTGWPNDLNIRRRPDPAAAVGEAEASNTFVVEGSAVPGGVQKYWKPVLGIRSYVGGAVAGLLAQQHISVAGGVQHGAAPLVGATFWVHHSQPLETIVSEMLVHSNNHSAEQLLRLLGERSRRPGTDDAGLETERGELHHLGILHPQMRAYDGSGLAPSDKIAPLVLAQLIAAELRGPNRGPFLASLPRVAMEGTVRYHQLHAALGLARAKSGHLRGVNGLAGTVQTRRHGRVAFAFLVNDPNSESQAVYKAQDRALDTLAKF
jgi:peptide/nickel transport system substrate-binding protein